MPTAIPTFSLRIDLAAASRAAGAIDAAASLAQSQRLLVAINAGMMELAAIAQKERFTGKGPFPVADQKLGVVTGRLRRDLHAEPVQLTTSGFSTRIGSNVEYFGAHEAGFDGTVQVKAHTRDRHEVNRPQQTRTSKGGKAFSIRANRYGLLSQSVRAHSRHMKVPARQPLITAIREHSQRIISLHLDRAIQEILNPT